MALRNPSFEDAGATPGEAAHWTLTAVTSRERVAGFGIPPQAWESFERWGAFWRSWEDLSVVRAFFDSARDGFEDFDEAWENSAYLTELSPALLVTGGFGERGVEDVEAGWDNEPYLREWESLLSEVADFSSEAGEAFETRWTTIPYATTWEEVGSVVARFGANARPSEDFETSWTATRTS